jgi:hypothetical protein
MTFSFVVSISSSNVMYEYNMAFHFERLSFKLTRERRLAREFYGYRPMPEYRFLPVAISRRICTCALLAFIYLFDDAANILVSGYSFDSWENN